MRSQNTVLGKDQGQMEEQKRLEKWVACVSFWHIHIFVWSWKLTQNRSLSWGDGGLSSYLPQTSPLKHQAGRLDSYHSLMASLVPRRCVTLNSFSGWARCCTLFPNIAQITGLLLTSWSLPSTSYHIPFPWNCNAHQSSGYLKTQLRECLSWITFGDYRGWPWGRGDPSAVSQSKSSMKPKHGPLQEESPSDFRGVLVVLVWWFGLPANRPGHFPPWAFRSAYSGNFCRCPLHFFL